MVVALLKRGLSWWERQCGSSAGGEASRSRGGLPGGPRMNDGGKRPDSPPPRPPPGTATHVVPLGPELLLLESLELAEVTQVGQSLPDGQQEDADEHNSRHGAAHDGGDLGAPHTLWSEEEAHTRVSGCPPPHPRSPGPRCALPQVTAQRPGAQGCPTSVLTIRATGPWGSPQPSQGGPDPVRHRGPWFTWRATGAPDAGSRGTARTSPEPPDAAATAGTAAARSPELLGTEVTLGRTGCPTPQHHLGPSLGMTTHQ